MNWINAWWTVHEIETLKEIYLLYYTVSLSYFVGMKYPRHWAGGTVPKSVHRRDGTSKPAGDCLNPTVSCHKLLTLGESFHFPEFLFFLSVSKLVTFKDSWVLKRCYKEEIKNKCSNFQNTGRRWKLNIADVHIDLGRFLSFTSVTDYVFKCFSSPRHVLGTVPGAGVTRPSTFYDRAQYLDLTWLLSWQIRRCGGHGWCKWPQHGTSHDILVENTGETWPSGPVCGLVSVPQKMTIKEWTSAWHRLLGQCHVLSPWPSSSIFLSVI